MASSNSIRNGPAATEQTKTNEKNNIVGLNDKFVEFIDKVRHLQEQNKVLETRLRILLEQEPYKANIEEIVAELRDNLEKQKEGLALDRQKLQLELARTDEEVDYSRNKYEDEIQKRAELENHFVVNKKDVDDGYLQKISLELMLEELFGEVDFLKRAYEEEMKELQSQVQNVSVVLEMDTQHNLDLNDVLEKTKAQYEAMAARTCEEAEQWNQEKMDNMVQQASKHEKDVRDQKDEIANLFRQVQRLKVELEIFNRQKANLENEIVALEERGENVREEATARIRELEEALRRAKQDMARQLRDYQELMNLKLALDIEIATYKKLLEGEEMRMNEKKDAPLH